ncbi:MAG: hypothetical protein ACFFG0_02065 [Candidatus Thorarchaeota archaeon]
MTLEKYLEKIQSKEAVGSFAIDSFPEKKKKKKRQIIRVSYPNENQELMFRRVMIDLDGTIHKYSKGYLDGSIYDEPFKDAKEAIDWLKSQGYEIVIFTTRASRENALETGNDHETQIANVGTWLTDHGIYYDRITAEKIAADFYIDDKAVVIRDGNWNEVLKTIKKIIESSH